MKAIFNTMKKLYLHSGSFNTDDVISAAMLKTIHPELKVERNDRYDPNEKDTLSLGIKGCEYDYESNKYYKDIHKNLYSLCSYVWEEISDELLASFNIENIELAKELFYERYISRIAVGTRLGFYRAKFFGEKNIFIKMNSNWYEECDGSTNSDQQFDMAVELGVMLLDNWMRGIKEDADYREKEKQIWMDAQEKSEDGIYVLERNIPWQYQIRNNPSSDAKIIIFKSNRGGYSVVSRTTDKIKIRQNDYLSFAHPSEFMGTADTLDNAIMAARWCIGNSTPVVQYS